MAYDPYRDHYYNGPSSNERNSLFTLALMLEFGKQWVFDDAFLVDIYLSLDYGIGTDDDEALPYGFIVAPDEFPLAYTSGIRIGWIFGK